jgi:aminoglycoside 6-adenylyltransferase
MRSEQKMYDLILNIARQDERVRAVILNGSRANPNASRDIFQDYDIIYVVTDVAALKSDPAFLPRFGKLMIMQLPDDMSDPPPGSERGSYAYLLQFADGNRIDLTLYPLAQLDKLWKDSLSVLLLDKDGVIPPFPPADESSYLPKPPTAKAFADCCNEFWWVCPYVAKGLWRGEIVYAHSMFEVVREQLMKMLAWYIGTNTSFALNPGKYGKYFERYLEPELWTMLLRTYADGDYDHTWEALSIMGELFRRTAGLVALHFGFDYSRGDDARVSAHLQHVRSLPKDAKEMYE